MYGKVDGSGCAVVICLEGTHMLERNGWKGRRHGMEKTYYSHYYVCGIAQ
jgi:hypothetical protein